MNSGVLELIRVFLSETWRLLTNFTIPGTGFSPAIVMVGMAVVSVGFKLLTAILGISFGGGESYRSQSRKGNISNERMGDEK